MGSIVSINIPRYIYMFKNTVFETPNIGEQGRGVSMDTSLEDH